MQENHSKIRPLRPEDATEEQLELLSEWLTEVVEGELEMDQLEDDPAEGKHQELTCLLLGIISHIREEFLGETQDVASAVLSGMWPEEEDDDIDYENEMAYENDWLMDEPPH
tara:strand:+ start:135292 stop:135627 length:336 start_codon:yes stop_codon:yes gene_type:complete